MKKFSTFLFATFIASNSMAQVPSARAKQMMEDDAVKLSTLLKIPLVPSSLVWTEPLFLNNEDINTNGLSFVKQDSPFPNSIEFIVVSNETTLATGCLFERSSFESACNDLMLSFVTRNMMINDLVNHYSLSTNNVGDFCVFEKIYDEVTNNEINNPSIIHFVRGAKIITIQSDNITDIQQIAKVLDKVLMNPPTN